MNHGQLHRGQVHHGQAHHGRGSMYEAAIWSISVILMLIVTVDQALAKPFPYKAMAHSLTYSRVPFNTERKVVVAVSLRGGGCCDDDTPVDALVAVSDFDEKCNERAKFVKQILCQRLQYVTSGKRMRDFAAWVRKNKGTSTIVSIHGIDESSSISSVISNQPVPFELESTVLKQLKHDPFSSDRMNLDIVLTSKTPDDCFVDKMGMSLELKPPNLLQLSIRAVQLSLHFAPVWTTVGLACMSQNFRENVWFKWIATAIGSSGAAWIKWGQWSSTRNDMFPEALCDHLSTLHAAAPAHSWSYSEHAVEQSLGLGAETLDCVFDSFDKEPLASGSIAQVHRAVLNGVPVAVKIRHPRVRQLMEMDFRLMTAAAAVVDKIPALSWLHVRESVEQFSHTIAAQAYLQVEAHHLELLNYNFRKWPRVKFPTPFYASSSIIIETFESGKSASDLIDEYDDMAAMVNNGSSGKENGVTVVEEEDAATSRETMSSNVEATVAGHDIMPLDLSKFLVSTGVSLYLKMLLVDNLMHADLHPGNIMVEAKHRQKNQLRSAKDAKAMSLVKAPSTQQQTQNKVLSAMDDVMEKLHITLVDAGMVARLTDEESSAFIGLMSSLGEGDAEEAAAFTLQFSLENSMTDEQRRLFAADMVTLFSERCRGYGTGVDVGHVLRGVLGLIRKHRVRIDANFATLVINCLCIESLARRVCPNYNVLDAARPLLQGYRRLNNKNGGSAMKSPFFGAWMALNAFKKKIYDALFFGKEGKRKNWAQRRIVEKIQVSSRALFDASLARI